MSIVRPWFSATACGLRDKNSFLLLWPYGTSQNGLWPKVGGKVTFTSPDSKQEDEWVKQGCGLASTSLDTKPSSLGENHPWNSPSLSVRATPLAIIRPGITKVKQT